MKSPLARTLLYFGIAFLAIVLLGKAFSGGRAPAAVGGGHVALIHAEGEITASQGSGNLFGPVGEISSVQLCEVLYELADDPAVKALVLRVNSPGGSAAASHEIFQAIQHVRESGKPVVVSMGDVAASGGYYISAPADYIFANGATLTGSIGVIFQLLNLEGLAEKIGVDDITLMAGKHKDIGNPFRQMTDEERQILKGLLSQVHDQFITAVAEGRKAKLTPEQVRGLATGEIWTGEGAVKVGLVDEVGGLRAAELKAKSLAKLDPEAAVVDYGDVTFMDILFGAEARLPAASAESLLRRYAGSSLQRLSGSLYLSTTLRDLVVR